MMRENDLRALLEDDARGGPDRPVPLATIARRVTTIRRRRYTAGATLAVAGVAAAVLVPSLAVRPATPSPPAGPTIRVVDGLPEYLSGGRLVDHAVFRGPARTPAPAQLTVPSYDVFLTVTCTGHGSYRVLINDNLHWQNTGGNCGGLDSSSWPSWSRRRSLQELGVEPGRPTSVRLDFTGNPTGSDTVTVGIYRLVPAGQFPLPPRPAVVAPINGADPAAITQITPIATVTPRRGDPNATDSRRVTVTAQLTTVITCTAPGAVLVLADGHPIHEFACWDYHQTSSDGGTIIQALKEQGVTARPGQQLTLTVRPSRFADPAWQVDAGTPVR